MGFEENRFDPRYVRPDGRVSMAEKWALEEQQRKAEETRMIENARADAKAIWSLADHLMPADFKEMADRLKMSETMRELWRNAFIDGWRAAHRKPQFISEERCQGHVASARDAKVCGRCGVHIDSLRPDDEAS